MDKDWKETEFVEKGGISANIMAKLFRNESVSMEVIVKICLT
ncbi:helix-turn-helix domain-containing protein [Longicatena caecimuris]